MKFVSCLLLLFCFSGVSNGAVSTQKIQKLVNDYESLQTFRRVIAGQSQGPQPLPDDPNTPHPRPIPPQAPNCPPNDGGGFPKGCMEAVCNHLSRFDCDEQSELAEIARMCRNVSAACVNGICNRVSRFDCDEKSEMQTVTNMCRGVVDFSCVDFVCSRLSRFDCDELDELQRIIQQCR